MIRSMTGFGKASARFRNGKVTIEIKTVNHKFFDATIKLPSGLSVLEDRIKEILQRHILRGKVNLNLIYDGSIGKEGKISVDRKAALAYHQQLSRLSKYLGVKDDITIKDIIAMPGVLSFGGAEESAPEFWPKIKSALDAAIARLVSDREKEGRATQKDLSCRAKNIERLLAEIRSRTHLNLEEYRREFAERVKDLSGGREIDKGRLEMEVAIYAKNSDISEEVNRLANHLANFGKTISSNGEVGKKLDFIAQELHREINTIGSKSSDFKISKDAIDVKGEIEKIREQAKNLE